MSSKPPNPGLWDLFWGFCSASSSGFGGVLPWARRMVVEQRRWLTASEFTDLLALCQFLPGPNVINLSVCLGARFRGLPGAAAAFSGVLAVPMCIVITLGIFYGRYGDNPMVSHAFRGLAAAASGLVLSTAWKIAVPLRGRPAGIAVAAASFAAIALLRVPLLPALAVLVPVSILAQRWRA